MKSKPPKTIEDINFDQLAKDCQKLAKTLCGSPDLYETINRCLFGPNVSIQKISIDATEYLLKNGHTVQSLLPWS
jgi:hypothetical protein